jgi:hypothetical protein
MYGVGDGSWCLQCHRPDLIVSAEGQFPEPQLYGQWRSQQEEIAAAAQSVPAAPSPSPSSSSSGLNSINEDSAMKQRKTHTGIYCCPECCLEFDLVADESLKCDDCGGLLYQGSLQEVLDEDLEPDQD